MKIKLRFFYKEGCYLCGVTEEMLNGLSGKYDLDIEKINIEEDDELFELYRYDIPVIEFEDGTTLHGEIKGKQLKKKLDELSGIL
ncbi:MAG: glutaredoxin family protein [Nitrospirae bacterium]|nr:MAG: glutaredoxin family protein [Nitrospirota bacterium]